MGWCVLFVVVWQEKPVSIHTCAEGTKGENVGKFNILYHFTADPYLMRAMGNSLPPIDLWSESVGSVFPLWERLSFAIFGINLRCEPRGMDRRANMWPVRHDIGSVWHYCQRLRLAHTHNVRCALSLPVSDTLQSFSIGCQRERRRFTPNLRVWV